MRHLYAKSTSLLFLLCLLSACQKEYRPGIAPGEGTLSNSGQQTVTAIVQGNIYDENGQPAVGARVTIGKQIAQSDEKGYFRIEAAALNANAALVSVEKTGYFKTFRSFLASSGTNQVMIQLTRKLLAGNIGSAAGGEAGLTNGAKIQLPANGIVYAGTGAPFNGTIAVYAAYIDPTSADISRAVPGSFMADNKEGQRVLLSSYGMLAVELESSTGEKLQVAPGKPATITVPIPATLASTATPSIPLWFVNEKTGLWQEEGSAVRTGNSYVGTVTHFTFWNVDKQLTAVKLSAIFKTADGAPLVNSPIRLTSKGAENVSGVVYTGSLGQINELAPSGQTLLVEVLDGCKNAIYSEQLPAVTADTDKGVIVLKGEPDDAFVTVTGTVAGCSAMSQDLYAVVSYNNKVQYVRADKGGHFSARFVHCRADAGKIEVYGIDIASQQRGNKSFFSVVTPVTQTGTIIPCGMAMDEYIRYNFDGNEFSIVDSLKTDIFQFDSTQSSGMPFVGTPAGNWLQLSARNLGSRGGIAFRVNLLDSGKAVTYTDKNVLLLFVDRNRILQQYSGKVNITSYALKRNEYFEGTFEMSFILVSQQATPNTLKGSFRIARR
jgi:hypothetical protein